MSVRAWLYAFACVADLATYMCSCAVTVTITLRYALDGSCQLNIPRATNLCCLKLACRNQFVHCTTVFMLVVLTYLLTNSVVHFLPQHLILLKQRVIYYLEGEL